MILEVASLTIKAGETAAFEQTFKRAEKVIARAEGYIAHELQRSVDVAGHYLLFVKWQTLEHHVVGFRGSPLFPEWRGLLDDYLASPPAVEHYELFA